MTATTGHDASAPSGGAAAVLEAQHVTVRFGGVVALDDVSLHVPSGGFVGLVGPNGAGKTTLFGALSGLVRPRAGRVRLVGVDVTRASPQRRARLGLARTFQRLELFTELTVREHVVIAHRTHERRDRRFLADVVGLEPTSGLDRTDVDRLAETLARSRRELGVAFALVEHNVEFVLGLAEHVTVLDFGHVIETGPPAHIRASEAVHAAYLGTTRDER